MFTYSAKHLDPHALKKILIGSVIPRPIALISTQGKDGIINLAPFSYFNLASYDPPVLMVSFIRQTDGSLKDTPRNLNETGQGVVHIVTEELVQEANLTAAPLPASQSELALTSWETLPCQGVQVPRLKEAAVAFEVELLSVTPVNDGKRTVSDVYLLQITHVHLREDVYDEKTGYINYRALQPMSRLAGDDYATLGELLTIIRPK